METNRRLALLIDGDNAQASLLPQMLAEVTKYGTLTIRRVYGDWTEPNMKSWKLTLHTHALQPVQQFRYTVGKNATDSALIIDAMDILYTAGVDGFCIASSDSDYTRLATRIREKNLFVLGIGKELTPRSFVNACDVFVYTENLGVVTPTISTEKTPQKAVEQVQETIKENAADLAEFEKLFTRAYEVAEQEDGWAALGTVGTALRKLDPAFDPRTYGYKRLSQLVRDCTNFIEVREEKTVSSPSGVVNYYVRPKQTKAKKKS
jgi:uncharacterized LabA/DUF88 family protein